MDLFFELLQVALGTRESLSRVPIGREWDEVYAEAERQSITDLFLSGIECLPKEQRPPKMLLLQWVGIAQMNKATYRLHCERAAELTRRFRDVGFKICILKGLGFAQYYPIPAYRQCGDIDVWVDGRMKDILSYIRSQYPIEHVVYHHADAKIFDDVATEIHYRVNWMYNPFNNHRLQMWFDKERKNQMMMDEKLGFAHPTVFFDAIYSLVHTFHHVIEEGIGLRHIVDYYFILKNLPHEAYAETMRQLCFLGFEKLTSAVMWVLKDRCNAPDEMLLCEPNEKEGRFLLKDIIGAGNFGYYRKDKLKRNSVARVWEMMKHYPCEALWIVPWKCWHWLWMRLNR